MFPYTNSGIEPIYSATYTYISQNPLTISELYQIDLEMGQFISTTWWDKQLSGIYVFHRHKRYLRQVLELCNLS